MDSPAPHLDNVIEVNAARCGALLHSLRREFAK
jgi:hypothetical protein